MEREREGEGEDREERERRYAGFELGQMQCMIGEWLSFLCITFKMNFLLYVFVWIFK